MSYNYVIFTDLPSTENFTRGYGAYRTASELRSQGYSCLVIDFLSAINLEQFKTIVDSIISEDTLAVGFSTTWFPYRIRYRNERFIVGPRSVKGNASADYDHEQWYKDSVVYQFVRGDIDKVIQIIKNKNSKCKITVGGRKSHEYIRDKIIDHVFVGYSETQLVDYMNSLSGRSKKRIFNKIIE